LLRDANGEPIEIVGCMLDISEVKQAELALRRGEERYRSLVDMHPDGMFINRDNRIAYANPAVVKLLGADSPEQIIGRAPLDFVHPDFRPLVRLRIEAMQQKPGVSAPLIEQKMLRLDGTVIEVEALASSFREDGSTAIQVVLRDLAEHRRKQRLLEASSARLRELTHALETVREEERGRLARELHDELGQLLTALRMDAAWIRQHAPKAAKGVIERADAMTDLLQRIGEATSRIATQLRPRVLDDLGLIAAVRTLAEETRTRCGIACQVTTSDEDLVVPDSLATPLFRMAQEALTNIARHSKATNVSMSLQHENGDLRLTIHDNGQGLAEDDLNKDGSYGLLGMRERAAAIRGEVKILSGAGEGTTVEIRVPFSPAGPTST
jgi:two-component system sensor histidine kinase UhpB